MSRKIQNQSQAPDGTSESIKALEWRLHVVVQDTSEEPRLVIQLDGETIFEKALRGTSDIFGIEIEDYYYIFEIEMEDIEVGTYTCFLYICNAIGKTLDGHDVRKTGELTINGRASVFVNRAAEVCPDHFLMLQVEERPCVIHEAPDDKMARLVDAIREIQAELEEVFVAQGEEETPVLEIVPGGCNFVVGDEVVCEGVQPHIALQTIQSVEWSE